MTKGRVPTPEQCSTFLAALLVAVVGATLVAGPAVAGVPNAGNTGGVDVTSVQGDGCTFGVAIGGTNSPVVEGDALEVTATVENSAGSDCTGTVNLSVGGEVRDATEVTLGPGESRSVPLEWATGDGDAGTYTAQVRATNDTATRDVEVREPGADGDGGANESLSVTLDYAPTDPSPDESVTFTANASDPDGEIASYEWRVDGDVVSRSESRTFDYAFESTGEYQVTVNVTDDDGTTASDRVNVTVVNHPPTVEVDYDPADPDPDEEVAFTADASDPDGEVESYVWTVDGEVVATGPGFTHAFSNTSTVSVTVEDDDGASASDEVTVPVMANDPPSVETGYEPVHPGPGEEVAFTADASDPDGEVESYKWVVDGVVVAYDPVFEYVFESAGEYEVSVIVEDDDNGTTIDRMTVTVNQPPTARIAVRTTGENVPNGQPFLRNQTVTFVANVSDPDGEAAGYEWRIDGETVGSDRELDHSFETVGNHRITLVVTDDDGASVTESVTVVVEVENEPPTVGSVGIVPCDPDCDGDPAFLDGGGRHTYSNIDIARGLSAPDATDPDGEIAGYEWRIDGEVVSHEASFEYTSESAGDHEVTLTVTDDDGATATASVTLVVEVENEPPTVGSIGIVPCDPDCDGDPVYVSGNDSLGQEEIEISYDRYRRTSLVAPDPSDPDGEIAVYEWSVDGETVGTDRRVEYTFESPGEYEVTLTVTDDDGATATVTGTVTANAPPEAVFDPPSASVGEETTVEPDASDPDGEIMSYEWWIDGDVVSEEQTLRHTFEESGDHEVTLRVVDDDGVEATARNTVSVTAGSDEGGAGLLPILAILVLLGGIGVAAYYGRARSEESSPGGGEAGSGGGEAGSGGPKGGTSPAGDVSAGPDDTDPDESVGGPDAETTADSGPGTDSESGTGPGSETDSGGGEAEPDTGDGEAEPDTGDGETDNDDSETTTDPDPVSDSDGDGEADPGGESRDAGTTTDPEADADTDGGTDRSADDASTRTPDGDEK